MIFFYVFFQGSLDLAVDVFVYVLKLLIELLNNQFAAFLDPVGDLPLAFVFEGLEVVL